MLSTALTVAPLLLAAVLAAAGVAKLHNPRSGSSSLVSMGVPKALAIPAVVVAHPWVEIALAALLTFGMGMLGVLGAWASLSLMLTYLWLVIQVLRRGEDVDCDCFGSLGESRVTAWTAIRNGWFVVLACLSVWAHLQGLSPANVLPHMGADDWWWLVAAIAAGLTVLFTVGGPGRSIRAAGFAGPKDSESEEYIRTPIPAVPVTMGDGAVRSLRDLSASRAQLLLFVSTTCGLCETIIEQAPAWRESLPLLDVRLVYTLPRPSGDEGLEENTVYDPERWAFDTLGIQGNPSAVVLGADGQLAGGPVAGPDEVVRFVADLAIELRHAVVHTE